MVKNPPFCSECSLWLRLLLLLTSSILLTVCGLRSVGMSVAAGDGSLAGFHCCSRHSKLEKTDAEDRGARRRLRHTCLSNNNLSCLCSSQAASTSSTRITIIQATSRAFPHNHPMQPLVNTML